MSRIADAYRKAGRVPFVPANSEALQVASGLCAAGDVPWDLEPPELRLAEPQLPAGSAPASIGVMAPHSGSARAVHAEDVIPAAQRILASITGTRPLRMLLLAGIERENIADLCVAMAEALADHTDGSICLVDANLRQPALHAAFGAPSSPGLSDLLRQREDMRRCLTQLTANLWLLPAGDRAAEAASLLTTPGCLPVAELRAMFAFVLIAASALGPSLETVSLARMVDGTVLVIEANTTRRQVAQRAVAELQAAAVHIVGAILSNREFPIPTWMYRHL